MDENNKQNEHFTLVYIYLERKVATCLSKIDLDFVA